MPDVCPSTAELAEAVREHLQQEVLGQLEGKAAYELRIAANILAIVQREAELGPGADRREHERLVQLLDQSGDSNLLNAELANRIRLRKLGPDSQGLLQHLRATAIDQLAIDNPKYTAYLRATQPPQS